MATSEPVRTVLADFSGGIFRNASLDRIPPNGSYDILNGLLDLQGGHFKRGGTEYRSTAPFGAGLRWVWDGWLASGHVTLLASTTAFGRLETNGSVTNLGEGGLLLPVRPAVLVGKMYFPGGKTYDGTTWGVLAGGAGTVDYVTVAANRLLVAHGSRIHFSKVNDPTVWEATDYHELPEGVQVIGLEGSRESCVVFTTRGIWVISGLTNELVDEAGNVQQRLDHYSGDITLWGDAGISAWEGSLIVPGTDAIWLIRRGVTSEQVGSFLRTSDSIRDLYRSYVADGFTPGGAAVFNNHYLLPIIGEGKIIDFLVCRLDVQPARGQPLGAWTRLGGAGADVAALVSRVSAGGSREPELVGAGYLSARALTLSYFNSATYQDADASTPEWSWQTPAIPTGRLVKNLLTRIRLRYQLEPGMIEGPVAVFPATTPTADTFFREEIPLAGNWTELKGAASAGRALEVYQPNLSFPAVSGAFWNPVAQANPAVFARFATTLLSEHRWLAVCACVQPDERSRYRFRYELLTPEPRLYLERIDGVAAPVVLAIATMTPSPGPGFLSKGDAIGLTVRHGVVRGWIFAGGVWKQVLVASDATYAGGHVGIEGVGTNVEVDEWGFGEAPSSVLVPNAPVIRAAIAADTPPVGTTIWGSFDWGVGAWASPATAGYEQLDGEAPADPSAGNPFPWPVRKKRRFVSFRFSCNDPAAGVAVKALELFVRPQGRL